MDAAIFYRGATKIEAIEAIRLLRDQGILVPQF
jgi:hypothetical protein